jgi:Cu(I)/Ag(I) efflux system membrane fusion protein
MWTGDKSIVYVRKEEAPTPTFEYREVALQERQGDYYLISAGLEAGEQVVTHGTFMLDASAQLNNKASMMNREITVKGQDGGIRVPDYQEVTPQEFRQQLLRLVTSYLQIKDALVATDSEKATSSASALSERIAEVNMNLLEGAAHMYWMERQENLSAHTNAMIAAPDIEEQRAQFEHLSSELIQAIKAFGIAGDKLFVQHCPMASNNQGADWISQDSFIANPYFGDQMLTCGLVTSTITSQSENAQ